MSSQSLLHVDAANEVLRKAGARVNAWETNFCREMVWVRRPSPKQLDMLAKLTAKTQGLLSIKDLLWHDVTLHLPSRLAWFMTEVSARSGVVYASRDTMMQTMYASYEEIDLALRTIVRQWKLFRWDRSKRAHDRVLKAGETSRRFKKRVQRTIDIAVGIAWVMRDLVEIIHKDGEVGARTPAPHGNKEFAEQLGCHPMTVSRALNSVLGLGYFRRYNRKRNMPLYARFDWADDEIFSEKYDADPRTEVASGVNAYIEPEERYVPAQRPPKSVLERPAQGHDDRVIQHKSVSIQGKQMSHLLGKQMSHLLGKQMSHGR